MKLTKGILRGATKTIRVDNSDVHYYLTPEISLNDYRVFISLSPLYNILRIELVDVNFNRSVITDIESIFLVLDFLYECGAQETLDAHDFIYSKTVINYNFKLTERSNEL